MKKLFGAIFIVSVLCFLKADNLSLVYQDANIKELRGVFALSNGKVWAVGTDGAVRKSTDNGSSWQTVNISGASDYHLNAVFFADENNGCIVGEKKADPDRFKGIIYRTTNGGSSWVEVPSGNYDPGTAPTKYIPFKDVVFQIRDGVQPNLGYIAAGEGWIYKTTNKGANWTREPVDNTKKHCFQSVAFDLLSTNTVYAVADAGHETGLIAYNSGSGWTIEYPFSNLGLNFFGVSTITNYPHIATSKGYDILKDFSGQWLSSQRLPDQNVLYGIGAVCMFVSNYMYGGSDEAIFKYGSRIYGLYGKYIKDVSLARWTGYPGPSIISSYTFFVGKDGRIFRYDPAYDPWPPEFVEVTGQSGRVKCVIFDSEEPSYAYIFRSTIPEGPYVPIANFDIPANQNYVWYDYSVDYSINYYYKISGDGQIPISSPSVAQPYNLPLPSYPSPVSSFATTDYSNDDGARTNSSWSGGLGQAVLYRDDNAIYIGSNSTFTDNCAITGLNHTYKVRRRATIKETDYIYSTAVTCNCTPVNNLSPSAPTNLTGEQWPGGVIKIRWNEPNNVDIHGYNIYRKINAGNYYKVNIVPCPRPFWYDTPTGYTRVRYKVSTVDWAGNESGYSNEIYFDTASQPDGNAQGVSAELIETRLHRIIPNPVSRNAFVNFSLSNEDFVRVDIYDATGRIVKNLVADNFAKGEHTLQVNLTSDKETSNGIYFIQLKTSNYKAVEKLIITR